MNVQLECLLSQRRTLARELERDMRHDLVDAEWSRAELERLRRIADRGGLAGQARMRAAIQAVQRRLDQALARHRVTLEKLPQLEELDRRIAQLRAAQHQPQQAQPAAQEQP